MLAVENRIFSWQGIPKSSRIILISTMMVIVFITPNLADGYYESSWNPVEINTDNNYNAVIIDEEGNAWIFGDGGGIIFGENIEQIGRAHV